MRGFRAFSLVCVCCKKKKKKKALTKKKNFTVSQTTLTQDLGVKVFSPLIYQNDAGLWNHFGYTEINHMIALYSADYLTTPAQAVENLNTGYKTILKKKRNFFFIN